MANKDKLDKDNINNINHIYIRKNISITEEQLNFLKINCISLSRFVQQKINEAITNGK